MSGKYDPQFWKDYRAKRRAEGICVRCGGDQAPELLGKNLCPACRDVTNEKARKRKAALAALRPPKPPPMTEEQKREKARAYRSRLVERGLCVRCQEPRGEGRDDRVMCLPCSNDTAMRVAEAQQRLVDRGLCRDCGVPRERKEIGRCNACNTRMKKATAKYAPRYIAKARAEGRCAKCCKSKEPERADRWLCGSCASRENEKAARRYREKKEARS